MLILYPLAEGGADLVNFNWPNAVWILCIFVVLVIVLSKTAWKNVLEGLKSRENRIRRDLADAQHARLQGEQKLAEFNAQLATATQKAQEIMAQANADANKARESIAERARQEAREIHEQALKEIDSAKQAAINEVYVQTVNIATAVAEKIIRRNLNPDDQRELVNQSLEQLKSIRAN